MCKNSLFLKVQKLKLTRALLLGVSIVSCEPLESLANWKNGQHKFPVPDFIDSNADTLLALVIKSTVICKAYKKRTSL